MRNLSLAVLNNSEALNLPSEAEGGRFPALISGLSGIHRVNLAAALAAETGRPLLFICPDESSVENVRQDLASFLGEVPAVIQSRDFIFYSVEGVSRQMEQNRISALYNLCVGKVGAVVCAASGLLQRTIPPEVLRGFSFSLKPGDTVKIEEVERRLVGCGYVRTERVEGTGQFSRRGGILDLFSPAHEAPVRVDFWGDDIDGIGFFDIDSQRRYENADEATVIPAVEALLDAHPGKKEGLIDDIEALAARISKGRNSQERKKHVATLREDAEKIRAGTSFTAADRYMSLIYPEAATLCDYIPSDALVFLSEPGRCAQKAKDFAALSAEDVAALQLSGTLAPGLPEFFLDWDDCMRGIQDFPVVMVDALTTGKYPMNPRSVRSIAAKQLPSYGGSAETAYGDLAHYLGIGYSVVVLAGDSRRAEILEKYFQEQGVRCSIDLNLEKMPEKGECTISVGRLSAGYEYPGIKLAVLTDTQIVQGTFVRKKRKSSQKNRQRLGSYTDLSIGDLVVHDYHGIGRFAGIVKMDVDGFAKDYIKISYAGTDSLYVPATQLDLVSKYIGGGDDRPVKLSKMGGTDWSRAKSKAKGAAKELAKGLIALYAERQRITGHAFAPDSPWQTEFEERFGYSETDDQLRCIEEIKTDMEKSSPMDRLLCGDVGYGKTEVAIRAAMKCVLDGKQAAILVPTTVLAQQHYQTAMQRFFGYPVRIDMMSRFRSQAQIKETLRDVQTGAVDIIIGTHRLIQKDVIFRDLGLLIIDEEQRFGVSHKERLKEMSRGVDVLTLSATPIPRTLNMALSGIRDMSTIEEPPQDRLPVQTFVMEHDWELLCDAIRREISRGGQVYYLHNRVENIEMCAERLSRMLEDISVAVAHGKMDEEGLSAAMESMVSGETQVLVCTTIIETGIDIPNVNTLIIEDADRLGLAQLHQIRGRVGRSSRRASAYLTYRKDKVLTEIAEKRLTAIREFAEFNAGFKIAMRDLEIRGAGNLLGAEQSGFMISVGYDMYLKLLEEAVIEERGEKPEVRAECAADLAITANIPESYVKSSEERMDLYRRIALIRTEEDADDLTDELIDRFGEPPPGVNALVQVALLRGEATRAGISDISQKAGYLRFVLTDFDMARVSELYSREKFRGKVKVEAGQKPCLSYKLASSKHVVDQAREFVRVYAEAGGKTETRQAAEHPGERRLN